MEEFRSIFQALVEAIGNTYSGHFTVDLRAEQSHFCRFNGGRVRQNGRVKDGEVRLQLIDQERQISAQFPFTPIHERNLAIALAQLAQLRADLTNLAPSPYVIVPQDQGSTTREIKADLPPGDQVIEWILEPDLDFCGYYGAGAIAQAHGNSAGQFHWFSTENFILDYSIFAGGNYKERAVKANYSDRLWEHQQYMHQIDQAQAQLQKLTLPLHRLAPGEYRAYLAPAAIAEIIHLMARGASEAALQQKHSPLLPLQADKNLSPRFNLQENFDLGYVPQFNRQGEVSRSILPIIGSGKLVNTLVSGASALEYGRAANGADESEVWRSPQVLPGRLLENEVLAALGTGLYLSNLHYLNWSDLPTGRFTGMTRYACFWVEGGEIVAPIANLRFDDSIYRCFGDHLIDLTTTARFVPDVSTYGRRALGGVETPGILVEKLRFTL
ncbi:MAG: metallopeptidase TldD-related protein [Pseudanabaenaceae cyanobacterium bins.68]|nr:metallopeptidase TldD-related protein [Pseudanabaenaceae cyanobacterium bins.68]